MSQTGQTSDPTPLSEAGLSAWRGFLRANSRLTATLDREMRERHGYALGDFDVLIQLAESPRGRLRMCELAEAVVLSPSGLSRRVDRLEREGSGDPRAGGAHARNVEARLTANGRRLLNRLRQTHREGVKARFTDRFSDSELELLSEFLGRLNNGS